MDEIIFISLEKSADFAEFLHLSHNIQISFVHGHKFWIQTSIKNKPFDIF